MQIQERINAFAKAGQFLSQFTTQGYQKVAGLQGNDRFYEPMVEVIERAHHHNGWFTRDQVLFALEGWAALLRKEALEQWTSNYQLQPEKQQRVAIIMAGNIPMVGFHDFLCVLMSGHQLIAKTASNDAQLIPLIANYLLEVAPAWEDQIEFTEDRIHKRDAVIATGSDNTARYFEYYFKDIPSIIRKNRNSVALLTGSESDLELTALGEDIFRYYGLGCRNVSKLMVPRDYDFQSLFQAIYPWKYLIEETKYHNNYDYNKAVFLMSEFTFLDNGFLIIKEDNSYSSPIGTLFYEYYDDLDSAHAQLEKDKDRIQCIVGQSTQEAIIPFGTTQRPGLTDYADGVDTLKFLEQLA
ncbi:acyl-CoA reductase [Croceiramulus getboli]|nr:acyl-CoA reductase [Flavobacteriaceae bacterium YJPT1-3]